MQIPSALPGSASALIGTTRRSRRAHCGDLTLSSSIPVSGPRTVCKCVRQGEPSPIINHAELFLLTEPRTLVFFKLQSVVMDALNWVKPQVLFLRLHDARERAYREEVVADEFDRFVRFTRCMTRRSISPAWSSRPSVKWRSCGNRPAIR